MKDFSEQIEKELVGDWGTAKPMPDAIYFKKVARRNLGLILACLLLTGLAVALAPVWIPNTYQSRVYAIFNPSNGTSLEAGTSRYSALSRLFKARFESQDFIKNVQANLDDAGAPSANATASPLSQIPWIGSRLDRTPKNLMKQFEASPELETGILALKTFASSSEQAQLLANVGMDTFINLELDEEIKNLDIKLNLLKTNAGLEAPTKVLPKAPESSSAKRAESLQNEDKERELDERLRALNGQIDQVRRERDGALTNLKRELVKLQTNFQANHPQVVEKRKELELVTNQYASSEEKVSAQANGIRAQLRVVRMNQSKTNQGTLPQVVANPDYAGSFFTLLADRIKEAELERQDLAQQKSDPSKRTQLKLLYPASLEDQPYRNNQRMAQYIFLFGGLALTLLLVILREWQTPLARDAWLIERLTGKKIISQISHKNTHEYTNITPSLADKMRAHLSKVNRIDEASQTLLSYRRLELSIMQECKGSVVLLVNAGNQDLSAQVIKNFLNIYATDHQDDYLLIDCNMQEPIYQFKTNERSSLSLLNFFEGTARFEDVCINREQMEDFAFDVIPPMPSLTGNQTRVYRSEKIAEAIENIPFKYKKIFIRGMPAASFIENRALLAAATDVFVFVDAKRTHYFNLQRTLIHLESDKIRGVVAIGT